MKKVIITIDTEGHAGSDPIRHLIMGETKSGAMGGIPLLMDLFDEVNARALFFVDFAEAFDYGKDRITEVVKYIDQRGHDVGVHIHPDHMTESKDKFLFNYSYDEQFSIIRRCTELYEEMLGKAPVAFRAGKYGANLQTLDILSDLGYKADFSQFYGYTKWCHIIPPVTGNESVVLNNGLIEFPVMSYNHSFPGLFDRYDKLDINCSRAEHDAVFSELIERPEVNVIVMFVHSFSLLNWRENVNNPSINNRIVANLRHALQQVNLDNNTCYTDLNSLLKDDYRKSEDADKNVFKISGVPALRFYAEKALEVVKIMYYSKRYGEIL